MIIYTDNENRIKAVGVSDDPNLTAYEINDEFNPFNDWTVAKILCYKATVDNGVVTMMTPYVDTQIIEHRDKLGYENEKNQANVEYVAMMTDVELPEV